MEAEHHLEACVKHQITFQHGEYLLWRAQDILASQTLTTVAARSCHMKVFVNSKHKQDCVKDVLLPTKN